MKNETNISSEMYLEGFDYRNEQNGTIYLTQDTIKWTPITNGMIDVYDQENNLSRFYLRSISFRTPSEHTVNGKHYDLEMQMIHVDKKQVEGAVVSIFFDRN